jgi:hypothetical protein
VAVVRSELGLSRGLLLLLAPFALLFMLLGGGVTQEAYAQSAPSVTATPTFIWRVPNANGGACRPVGSDPSSNCLQIDPLTKQFEYYAPVGPLTPTPSPIATQVRDMIVTQQRVVWKWNDPQRRTFVWGNVDRVRKTVKMTLWRREPGRPAQVTYLYNQGTPWPMPTAEDPKVVIQDLRFNPQRLVISRYQQVNFQNNTRFPCAIRFEDYGVPVAVVDRLDDNRRFSSDFVGAPGIAAGQLQPGRIAPPFPWRRPAAPTPNPQDPDESRRRIDFWGRTGSFPYRCDTTSNALLANARGVIVVRGD